VGTLELLRRRGNRMMMYPRKFRFKNADDVHANEEENPPFQKGARMTANQCKATNFYMNARIEGQNKMRAALMRVLIPALEGQIIETYIRSHVNFILVAARRV